MPIVQREHRRHESMAVNFRQPRVNLHQELDTPDGNSITEIELVSMTGDQYEFNKAELNFIHWLDTEIKKMDDFYREKERVAARRYKLISAQLNALGQLSDSHLTVKSFQDISTPEPSSHHKTSGLHSTWKILVSKIRTTLGRLSSAMPTADHERRAKHPELVANPITTTAGYVEYRVARRQLKHAMVEFYRGMELLEGYRSLNRMGLEQILEKFDKFAGRKISGDYSEKLKSVHFNQSNELEKLMENTQV
jgi:xenotropic and polytropic retrovirus receptor 1